MADSAAHASAAFFLQLLGGTGSADPAMLIKAGWERWLTAGIEIGDEGSLFIGERTGYGSDPTSAYRPPASIVMAAGTSSPVGNPAGPIDHYQMVFGDFIVAPPLRAAGTFGDFDGWRPGLWVTSNWTDGSPFITHPLYGAGSPKTIVGGGLGIREINDTGELFLDRGNSNASGTLIAPVASDTIGRIYFRMLTEEGGALGTLYRCAEILGAYIHPTTGKPGGRLTFNIARTDNVDGDNEPILRLEADAFDGLSGTGTGLQLRSEIADAGAWKDVNVIPAGIPQPFTSGGAAVAADATVYLGPGAAASSDMAAAIAWPAGRIGNLRVRSENAPGSGKTFIYTVLVNGVVTNPVITATISGDTLQAAADITHFANITDNQRVSVQLVTLAGAAACAHAATLGYGPGLILAREV